MSQTYTSVISAVNAAPEAVVRAQLKNILLNLRLLGFDRNEPINGGDCVEVVAASYMSAKHALSIVSLRDEDSMAT